MPVSPSYYDCRFPAAAKADAGKARTPLLNSLDKKIVVINGVDEFASELRKIGNNLNQLTRAVNSGFAYEVDLRETREEVARIWQSLNSLLQEVR